MKDKDFIIKLLTDEQVVAKIRQKSEQLTRIIPEIKHMMHFEHQHPHHHLDVWEHTLLALENSNNNLKTRISLLLHDIGKPFCYQQDGEIRHYNCHAEKSATMAKTILERLQFDSAFINEVFEIIKRHDIPLTKSDLTKLPALSREIFEVQKCDALAHNPKYNQKRLDYITRIEAML